MSGAKGLGLRIGLHVSMSGGPLKALERARRLRLESIQIFSGNPRAFFSKPLDEDAAAEFRNGLADTPLAVHAPYPMNPANPEDEIWQRSVDMLVTEMERCALLGGRWLVFHPGGHLGSGRTTGLERAATALARAVDRGPEGIVLAVENTSGAGTGLGGPSEDLAAIIDRAGELAGAENRFAVWLDTAHAFGYGHRLDAPAGVDGWLDEIGRVVGLDRVAGLHINDSKAPAASLKDRHEHLGQGLIGGRGLGRVLAHPQLNGLPGVLETPRKGEADERRDLANARRFRTLGLKALKEGN